MNSHPFEMVKEKSDLDGGRLWSIRSMDGIALDVLTVSAWVRPRRGLLRIGCAHEVAQSLEGIVALQEHRHHGPGGHVGRQALVEGALCVHSIKLLSGLFAQMRQLEGTHAEALFLH